MPLAKRLDQLEIEGLRGIRKASIGPLADVNLFVGKNNCGKTTVLEAILRLTQGSARRVQNQAGIEYLAAWCARRGDQVHGPDLVHRSTDEIRIAANGPQLGSVQFRLRGGTSFHDERLASMHEYLGAARAWWAEVGFDSRIEQGLWRQILANRWDKVLLGALETVFGVRAEQVHLVDGRLMLLLPDQGLQLDSWGDGLRVAARSFLLLVSMRETLLLLEEPECHQHPGSLKRYAQAMVDLARANRVQLFITTHSDECLKAFVDACGAQTGDDRMEAAIFHLRRSDDGDVTSTRIAPSVLDRLTEQHVDVRNLDLYE